MARAVTSGSDTAMTPDEFDPRAPVAATGWTEDLSAEEARAITDDIKLRVRQAWELIVEAYQRRAWAVLGYESWDAYCLGEFGGAPLPVPREERPEMVASLRQAGLSQRAIASATGVSQSTIRDDVAQVSRNYSPDAGEPITAPQRVPGEPPDQSYRGIPQEGDTVTMRWSDGTAWILGKRALETFEKHRTDKVTGRDGKSYPAKPRPKPDVPKPQPQPQPADEPRPIDTLIADLESVVAELERHRAMMFAGNEEIDPRTLRHHPFSGGAGKVVDGLAQRLAEHEDGVSRDLGDAEDLREIWPTMTAAQKRRYLRELEDSLDHDEYNAMARRRYDKRTRCELRAKIDAGTGYISDGERRYLKTLDERAKAEGWADE
jgi:hypothetical protein